MEHIGKYFVMLGGFIPVGVSSDELDMAVHNYVKELDYSPVSVLDIFSDGVNFSHEFLN